MGGQGDKRRNARIKNDCFGRFIRNDTHPIGGVRTHVFGNGQSRILAQASNHSEPLRILLGSQVLLSL